MRNSLRAFFLISLSLYVQRILTVSYAFRFIILLILKSTLQFLNKNNKKAAIIKTQRNPIFAIQFGLYK
jgi:hypothetical protein